jgi:DNA polymerase
MSERHPSNAPKTTIDFETRSDCSIRNCGTWRYSLDPTTEVLCLAFRLPYWEPGRTALWHPALPAFDIAEGQLSDDTWAEDRQELFDWIAGGGLVEAHNAWFERGIWKNICAPRLQWPEIAHDQWRCSAAKAASHSLPRGLEDAADALDLPITKDTEGAKVMKKMAKPRKPIQRDWKSWRRQHAPCKWCEGVGKIECLKKDGTPTAKPTKCPMCGGYGADTDATVPPMPMLWHESVDMFFQLFDYCRVDVLAEEGVSDRLPDLSSYETQIYLLDQAANERGFMLDREGIQAALDVIDEECAELNQELVTLTDGQVTKATQRGKMLDWLADQGLDLPNTQAGTIDAVLNEEDDPFADLNADCPDISDNARRGLELMRTLGRSSTAKFVAAANWICPDDRLHGGLLYHGAGTGRWSGQGIQPQNFPRGSIKDIEQAWDIIKTRSRDAIKAFPQGKDKETGEPIPYNDVMAMLSHAIRGVIIAPEGQSLFVADYAAIEARVLLWLAEDEDALQVFHRGEDIYCYAAADIFGYPCNKKDHPFERSIGKIAVLGLGYQMGASKFVDTAALGGVTMPEDIECLDCGLLENEHRKADHPHKRPDGMLTAKSIVVAYRTKFWRVVALWKELEEAAIDAVLNPGKPQHIGRMTYYTEDGFLYCVLPSGRRLAYPEPEIRQRPTPWGDWRDQLTYMGVNPLNRQWQRQTAYGGLLAENITQAVARDLMAAAYLRCEHSGLYIPVLTVHDELIAYAPDGTGDVKQFEKMMAENPRWAHGCPVDAEGWSGKRYRK